MSECTCADVTQSRCEPCGLTYGTSADMSTEEIRYYATGYYNGHAHDSQGLWDY